jgi:hypothetical protein
VNIRYEKFHGDWTCPYPTKNDAHMIGATTGEAFIAIALVGQTPKPREELGGGDVNRLQCVANNRSRGDLIDAADVAANLSSRFCSHDDHEIGFRKITR